jgi:hypothetical protein
VVRGGGPARDWLAKMRTGTTDHVLCRCGRHSVNVYRYRG